MRALYGPARRLPVMQRTPAKTEPAPLGAAAECVALSLTTLILTLLFWVLVQREHYAPLLSLAVPAAAPEEKLALLWTVCAETLLFLAPGVIAAALAIFGASRASAGACSWFG